MIEGSQCGSFVGVGGRGLVEEKTLERFEGKAKRVIDRREL